VQKLLFIVSVLVVGFFEYGVRMEGGYKNLMEGSSVSHDYLLYVLIFHIMISVVTLVLWIITLYRGNRDKKQSTLPGRYSASHKKDGQRTFVGIILTMLTGAWVYMLLFVF
jgi:putative membrane protein